jgi:heterodisulfide reductase subunit A
VAGAGGLARTAGLAAECAALREHGVELLEAGLVAGSVRAAPGGGVEVTLADGLLELTRRFSLLVLHEASTGAPGAAALAALLRLKVDARGFIDEPGASPFEPTSTRVAGIMVAGAAAGPRQIGEAIRDGAAAAGRVLSSLMPGERRELEPLAVQIDPTLCGGCGICVASCPSHAVAQSAETGKAHVEPAHCHACGTCSAACPTGAAMSPHFTREQLSAELAALLADPAPGGP